MAASDMRQLCVVRSEQGLLTAMVTAIVNGFGLIGDSRPTTQHVPILLLLSSS